MLGQLIRFVAICFGAVSVLLGCLAITLGCYLTLLNRNIQNAYHRTRVGESQSPAATSKKTSVEFFDQERFFEVPTNDNAATAREDATKRNAAFEQATRDRIAGYDESNATTQLIRKRIQQATQSSQRQLAASSRKVDEAVRNHEQSLERRKVRPHGSGGPPANASRNGGRGDRGRGGSHGARPGRNVRR